MTTLDRVLEIVARVLPPSDLLRLVEDLRPVSTRAAYQQSVARLAAIAQKRYNPSP